MKSLHSTKQRIFVEEIADVKMVTVTLVKAKRVQIPSFHGTDLQIRDKARSIIKAKIYRKNNTQDKEELLLKYYNFYETLLCFFFVVVVVLFTMINGFNCIKKKI